VTLFFFVSFVFSPHFFKKGGGGEEKRKKERERERDLKKKRPFYSSDFMKF